MGQIIQTGSTVWKALPMEPVQADPNLAENAWMETGKAIDDFDVFVKRPKNPERVFKYVASSELVDYDDEKILINAWRLKNYKRKRVILWAHGHRELPVASAIRIRRDMTLKQLLLWAEFFPYDIYWWADQVMRVVEFGGLPDGSVGFKNYKGHPREDDDKGPRYTFEDVELLEFSVCPVGANADAMVELAKGFDSAEDAQRKIWAGFTPEAYPRRIVVPPGEKIEDYVKSMVISPTGQDADQGSAHDDVTDYVTRMVTLKAVSEIDEAVILGDLDMWLEDPKKGLPTFDFGDYETLQLWVGDDEIPSPEGDEKPYIDEHACRLKPPGKYDRFARKNCYQRIDKKCVDFIFGIKANKSELQSMRFKKKVWTAAAAKKVCSDHEGRFEPAGEAMVDERLTGTIASCMQRILAKLTALQQVIVADVIPRLSAGESPPSDGDRKDQKVTHGEVGPEQDRKIGEELAWMHKVADRFLGPATPDSPGAHDPLLRALEGDSSGHKKGGEKT